jgi:hypothetical protein
VASAAAINIVRISNWLMDRDRAATRTSAYQLLMKPPDSD